MQHKYSIFVGKHRGRAHLGAIGVDVQIISKCILKRYGVRV